MRAGALDRRVTIESKTVTRDDFGAEVITWGTFAEVWAEVRDVSAVEKVVGEARTMARLTTIRTRYVPGVTGDMRIRLNTDGRVLQITSMAEIGRRLGWSFLCEAYSV
jgi:SPP1 family predicted phage head-tail adaptor